MVRVGMVRCGAAASLSVLSTTMRRPGLNSRNSLRYYSDIEMLLERNQMAIAKNPKRSLAKRSLESRTTNFIAAAGTEEPEAGKKPVLLRFSPEILARIDRTAKRLGITRSAFIYMASVKELEKIEA